jgi:hypothetical protein
MEFHYKTFIILCFNGLLKSLCVFLSFHQINKIFRISFLELPQNIKATFPVITKIVVLENKLSLKGLS